MSDSRWSKTVVDLKKELAWIESGSRHICSQFEMLLRQAESLKIAFLKYSLEEQRKAMALQRGLVTVVRDKKKMGTSLAVAAGGLILGGLITKDKYVALSAGLSGFDGIIQGFGEARWAVSLEKELVVAPYDSIPPIGTWVTLDSLIAAIDELKAEVLQGKPLRTLDNIIQRLQQSQGKLVYITLPN